MPGVHLLALIVSTATKARRNSGLSDAPLTLSPLSGRGLDFYAVLA